jgi:hypothetical protein
MSKSRRFAAVICSMLVFMHANASLIVPTSQFCGALTANETTDVREAIVNVSLSDDGTYNVEASIATYFPFTCAQSGTYVYNAATKRIVLSPPSEPSPGSFNCLSYGFNFTDALNTSSKLSPNTLLTLYGTFNGQEFSMPANEGDCFARIPSGTYCGTALDVPASVVVSAPFDFALNVEAVIFPCTISGFYVLSATFGSVVYAVGSSNCTEYLIFNNVTYARNPDSLTLAGSAYGVGFTATMTEAQCP